jgi:hypothetical protein
MNFLFLLQSIFMQDDTQIILKNEQKSKLLTNNQM